MDSCTLFKFVIIVILLLYRMILFRINFYYFLGNNIIYNVDMGKSLETLFYSVHTKHAQNLRATCLQATAAFYRNALFIIN